MHSTPPGRYSSSPTVLYFGHIISPLSYGAK